VDREQIVTDIDSTILRTERRLKRVLHELGWEELFPQLHARYDGVKALLGREEQERFYQLFLSNRYLKLDEPLPGAAEVLQALQGADYRIVYLTGRHDAPEDSMRRGTEEWLAEHGFPHPQDGSTLLLMKPRRRMDDRGFKEEALKEILKWGPVRAGIGDRPSDVEAYLSQGIRSIIIWGDHYPRDRLRAVGNQAEMVRDWIELKALLLG
jgi:hypothetical protein